MIFFRILSVIRHELLTPQNFNRGCTSVLLASNIPLCWENNQSRMEKKNNVIQVSALLLLETEVIVQYSGKNSIVFGSYFQNQGSMLYLSLVCWVTSVRSYGIKILLFHFKKQGLEIPGLLVNKPCRYTFFTKIEFTSRYNDKTFNYKKLVLWITA